MRFYVSKKKIVNNLYINILTIVLPKYYYFETKRVCGLSRYTIQYE
jgi:hypothetical protein